MAEKYISINEFMDHLKKNSLIIVSADEFELNKAINRKRAMKKKSLYINEIITHELLPLKSTKAVIDWIENGKIKPTEWIREQAGKKRYKVLTVAIKRLGYVD